ncbi:hypothetical protein SISNIDRAFT_482187 [Sistotremastrum niveocremeum HHB9708]|uniref:Uncharacterized protein n=1 Tax=Sistotremastrum niveocremeum HHB9708 TaxID=1314777 RepID=A0A164YUU9_9AGAM|nr:hypothetical protein SISNIDRAFT_482187 [Sistotremastrum niveocremeum HHB9708]
MKFSVALVVCATLFSTVFAAVLETVPTYCPDGTEATLVSSQILDGAPLTHTVCNATAVAKRTPEIGASVARDLDTSLTKRGYDLCGAPCTTVCSKGSGGPNPKDCEAIAKANQGAGEFSLTQGYFYQFNYKSCRVVLQAVDQDIVYCWDKKNLAGVIDFVATHCQAKQKANGGTCEFLGNTKTAYVQVETV